MVHFKQAKVMQLKFSGRFPFSSSVFSNYNNCFKFWKNINIFHKAGGNFSAGILTVQKAPCSCHFLQNVRFLKSLENYLLCLCVQKILQSFIAYLQEREPLLQKVFTTVNTFMSTMANSSLLEKDASIKKTFFKQTLDQHLAINMGFEYDSNL